MLVLRVIVSGISYTVLVAVIGCLHTTGIIKEEGRGCSWVGQSAAKIPDQTPEPQPIAPRYTDIHNGSETNIFFRASNLRLAKAVSGEYSPVTKAQVPQSGAEVTIDSKVVNETEEVSLFHPVIVLDVDYRLALGIGVQFFRFGKFNLAAIADYFSRSSELRGLIQPSYRLHFTFLDSGVSVGPYIGFSFKQSRFVLGGSVIINLTK